MLMILEVFQDFGKKEFCIQLFQKLIEYFIKFCFYGEEKFYLFLYILCVIFDKRENDVKKDIVSVIYLRLNKNIVVMNLLYLVLYVQIDGEIVEIKYDVIVIVLFYVFMMKLKKFWLIFCVCDIRGVLEFI